ncbi:CDP-glycerol glycerophosphotransferase family protein [Spirillospora sp. NPDC047279]|uniref:bifunctional glycosyltransferase/CDP-glycerol:glycerophosphate glycerophosphotransferase n=1 Tax=Spirillospora sp. NPDC047279 TaxID=3155478 RepID=UPI00340A948E
MPKVSVIVPVYNVAPYVEDCLESLAAQTLEDIEVVVVDDGSTDDGGAIVARFAAGDPRFTVVTKENAGLGAARNTGIDRATGEFLAFLDSDDLLPPYALEYMAATLDRTGSDFATGNVRRFDALGPTPSPMHQKIFRTTALRTHVTGEDRLLADRLVTNKLWRRSFWDAQGLRFPEGVLHEDIVVALTGHFSATAVDMLKAPVYLWRIRPNEDKSITQDRTADHALEHRVKAVEGVGSFLAERGMDADKRRWELTVVGDDLRLFLQVLDSGDEAYRERFLDQANAYLDGTDLSVLDDLPAIERLKWHLVRRRLMPELLEVLKFQKSREMAGCGVVRRGRRYYGNYPYLDDPAVGVPLEIYRLQEEIRLRQKVTSVRWENGRLLVEGRAVLKHLKPDRRWKHQVLAWLVCEETGRRVPVPATLRRRTTPGPAGTAKRRHDWGGYRITIDPRRLTSGRSGRTWRLDIWVLNRGVLRKDELGAPQTGEVQRPERHQTADGLWVCPEWSENGRLRLRVERHGAEVQRLAFVDGEVELSGVLEPGLRDATHLVLTRSPGGDPHRYPLLREDRPGTRPGKAAKADTFQVRIPLADLWPRRRPSFTPMSGEALAFGDGTTWTAEVETPDGETTLVRLVDGVPRPRHRDGLREIAVHANVRSQGGLEFRERAICPLIDTARWTADGRLVLGGDLPVPPEVPVSFVFAATGRTEEVGVPVGRAGQRFTVEFDPAAVTSLAGALPLPKGNYRLAVRVHDGETESFVRAQAGADLFASLPAEHETGGRTFTLIDVRGEDLMLRASNDLRPAERSRASRIELRDEIYPRLRHEPLRPWALFESYFGRQYSDSPRAILEELRRRDAPYEFLWIVDNGQAEVPEGVTVVRRLSREYFEALARAEFIVSNSHLPMWFERRPEQKVLQTWHGATLKRIGFDIERVQFATRNYHEKLATEVGQWTHLISPSPWCTPILERAFRFEGRTLETGYPRNDIFFAPEQEEIKERVRRRIGLPEGKKVVLYAPTWRDDKFYRRGKYRLDLQLDLEEMWRRLGDDHVLLVRRHPNIVDRVPEVGTDFVFDVSVYPEMQELLLISDVLVTDYSSVMFDFAITRRPMVFFTYDLETYRDTLRGFYFDFEAEAPGPLLRTSAEVIDALVGIDDVAADHAGAYQAFVDTHCPLDDGKATIRVVERVFGA